MTSDSEWERPPPDEDAREHRKLGLGMIVMAWIAVLAVLAVPLWHLLEDRVNPNRSVQGARLDLSLIHI